MTEGDSLKLTLSVFIFLFGVSGVLTPRLFDPFGSKITYSNLVSCGVIISAALVHLLNDATTTLNAAPLPKVSGGNKLLFFLSLHCVHVHELVFTVSLNLRIVFLCFVLIKKVDRIRGASSFADCRLFCFFSLNDCSFTNYSITTITTVTTTVNIPTVTMIIWTLRSIPKLTVMIITKIMTINTMIIGIIITVTITLRVVIHQKAPNINTANIGLSVLR